MWLHFTWEPEEQNKGKKTANDSQTRIISSHQDAHLHPGMVVLLLRLHKKAWNKKKKGYSPCAITQAFGACARVHLSAFVYELFVCAPQALGCWVCSLKRLCFCCHPSLSLSFPLCVSRSHLDSPTCFVCRLYRSPSPFCPSVFHYQCFIIIVGKSTRRNVGGLSHSQPFTSSTGNDLMLFKREAG